MNEDFRHAASDAGDAFAGARQARERQARRPARWLILPSIALAALFASPAMSAPKDAPGPQDQKKQSRSFVDDFDSFDKKRWFVSDGWNNGPHQNCTWSKDQTEVKDGVLVLSFEKGKLKDRDYSCAEVQTRKRFSYGTYEARMKTDTGSGINAAFFTYIGSGDKQPHDEIDFEVLTKSTSRVQVNVFASGKGKNEKMVDVKGGTDAKFNDYAFVWEPDRLRWYVNGELVNTITDPKKIPSHPQKIFFSLWGSGTLSQWMGKFADPGRRLTFGIDRVAFTALGEPCQFADSLACKLQ